MFQKEQMKNGIRVVMEPINYVNSVSIGIWVKVGSRYESINNNGVSHFIEHMLFKGTKKRTAKEIANSIDKIGGQLNAFTSKESTCYYAKVLDSHFEIALDVLADMFFNSNFSQDEIDKERGVILEEISMYEDSPEDLVHDLFSQAVWPENPLGMSILGTEESLQSLDRNNILDFYSKNYIPENIVISVVGNIKPQEVLTKITKYFEDYNPNIRRSVNIAQPVFSSDNIIRSKDTEQVHLCLGFNGLDTSSEYFYSMLVVNNVFGGAMSSRLFQNIREDKGLAYSVFSYPSAYLDCGLFSIYAGMKPTQLQKVSRLIMEEIELIKKNGITQEELYDSKEQLKGSYILGLESTSGRMISIGKSELMLDKIYSPNEIIEKISRVDMNSIEEVIKRIFSTKEMGTAIIGPVDKNINIKKLFT